jgi:hypothetical protein
MPRTDLTGCHAWKTSILAEARLANLQNFCMFHASPVPIFLYTKDEQANIHKVPVLMPCFSSASLYQARCPTVPGIFQTTF